MILKTHTLVILLSLTSFLGCKTTQLDNDNVEKNNTTEQMKINSDISKVIYKIYTRGYQKKYTLTPTDIIISENEIEKTSKISPEKWSKIIEKMNHQWVEEAPSVEPPTMNFTSDSDKASVLIITMNGSDYSSKTFDMKTPPKEFKELIENITKKD